MISVNHTNTLEQETPYVLLIEVRGSYGTTRFIGWQAGIIAPLESTNVGMLWTPGRVEDNYSIRSFVISGFEEPIEIFSPVSKTTFETNRGLLSDTHYQPTSSIFNLGTTAYRQKMRYILNLSRRPSQTPMTNNATGRDLAPKLKHLAPKVKRAFGTPEIEAELPISSTVKHAHPGLSDLAVLPW